MALNVYTIIIQSYKYMHSYHSGRFPHTPRPRLEAGLEALLSMEVGLGLGECVGLPDLLAST